jgi:hypothetical protein
MQINQMLQQLLTTLHPSGVPPSATGTNLVIPPAAATILDESPPQTTEIIAATSPPSPSPPLQQQQQVAGASPVGVGAAPTPVNPYADLPELPVPIFSPINNNALPATFSALLNEYQRYGHVRYKNIKGRKTNWSNDQKFALHKRHYLYDQMEREAHAMGSRKGRKKTWQVRLDAAAVALDQKYKNKSLDQAMREIKAADHTVKPRRKRRRTAAEMVNADTTAAAPVSAP